MFHVYILRGSNGRHYIGQTADLAGRLEQHRRGHTHTTRRLGDELLLVASAAMATRADSLALERKLKAWKNPAKVIEYLRSLAT
jgi:predicted GIY-YIG superfamily endonuclease